MSVSRTFLKRIQKSVSGTVLCKNVLVVVPTEHILRGFSFDRTRQKDMFSFYQLVMPLYTPTDYLYLTYSTDLTRAQWIRLVKEEIDVISKQILKIVVEGLPYLRSIRGPKEFLDEMSWMTDDDRNNVRIDLALTHFMLGNVQLCLQILEDVAAKTVGSSFEPYQHDNEIVTPLIDDLRTDPSRLAQKIETWERENIERFGLTESTIDVVR